MSVKQLPPNERRQIDVSANGHESRRTQGPGSGINRRGVVNGRRRQPEGSDPRACAYVSRTHDGVNDAPHIIGAIVTQRDVVRGRFERGDAQLVQLTRD